MTRSFQDVVNTAGKSLRACLDYVCGVEHINMEARRRVEFVPNDRRKLRTFIPASPTWSEPEEFNRMPLSCRYRSFLKDNNGATAVEYGFIAAGISLALIVVIPKIGVQLAAAFTKVGAAL